MASRTDQISRIIDQIDTTKELKNVTSLVSIRWRNIQRAAIADLKNGMRVKFEDKGGVTVVGTIKGLTANNIRSVPITTNSGQKWRVAPNLLKIIKIE